MTGSYHPGRVRVMTKTYLMLCVMTLACTPGPQGPEGPQGPTGPTGASGAPGADAVIADGSITREKLARESVLPEHRGRSNSVVSFPFVVPYTPDTTTAPATTGTIFVVPSGKSVVITDIVILPRASGAGGGVVPRVVEIRSQLGVGLHFRLGYTQETAELHLESGVRFSAGEAVQVRLNTLGLPAQVQETHGTLMGYEY
jgi:hypothetical protein